MAPYFVLAIYWRIWPKKLFRTVRASLGMRSNRIFGGDFHTPAKKSAFLRLFLRFFLAFAPFLGYSPSRPEFLQKKEG
jgi:hypothetical protein